MLELRCTHVDEHGKCDRFLFKLEGGFIVIKCARCKTEQRIPLAELVLQHVTEARELEAAMNGTGGQLMW